MAKRIEIDTTDTDKQEADAAANEAAMAADSSGAPTAGTVQMPAMTFDQLLALVQAGRMSASEIAEISATAAAKAKKPENIVHPGKSVYSYPEGEVAHPKPFLKCRMYFASSPMERVTMTPAEVEAANSLTPGHYRVTKMDGSTAVIEIRGQVNSNQELDRLWILFPEGDTDKNLYPGLSILGPMCSDANRVRAMAGA